VSDAPKHSEPSRQPDGAVEGAPARYAGPTSALPAAGQPGTADGPPAGPGAPKPSRTGRTVAIVIAAVLATMTVLCIGGLGAGYLLYRHVSEPDRSTPGVTLRQYLEATLNDRDDSRARLFTCRDASGLTAVRQLRDDLESTETQHGVSIRTAPEDFETRTSGARATVGVKLRLSVSSNGTFQEQIQSWTFSLRKESGWRVCAGEQIA
jgi:hypothetical protein